MEDEDLKKKLFLQEVLREDSKFVCNATGLRKSTTVSSRFDCLSLGRYGDEDMETKV